MPSSVLKLYGVSLNGLMSRPFPLFLGVDNPVRATPAQELASVGGSAALGQIEYVFSIPVT
jgi:hypothetical protein